MSKSTRVASGIGIGISAAAREEYRRLTAEANAEAYAQGWNDYYAGVDFQPQRESRIGAYQKGWHAAAAAAGKAG